MWYWVCIPTITEQILFWFVSLKYSTSFHDAHDASSIFSKSVQNKNKVRIIWNIDLLNFTYLIWSLFDVWDMRFLRRWRWRWCCSEEHRRSIWLLINEIPGQLMPDSNQCAIFTKTDNSRTCRLLRKPESSSVSNVIHNLSRFQVHCLLVKSVHFGCSNGRVTAAVSIHLYQQ
jgi:hypothetical protein